MKYVVGAYGPWGTLDVHYAKLVKGVRGSSPQVHWTTKARASRFKTLARAGAFAKGLTATGKYGSIIEPVD